jgi:P27 family predicted phage terminase small subunit
MSRPENFIVKLPPTPNYLSKAAGKEYKRLGKALVETRRLTELDLKLLENACVQYGVYQDIMAKLQTGGKSIADYIVERDGNAQKLGEVNIMNKACADYMKVLKMFMARKPGELNLPDDEENLSQELGL